MEIPMEEAIREGHQIRHRSIFIPRENKQFWESISQSHLPTPTIMPKLHSLAIPHQKRTMGVEGIPNYYKNRWNQKLNTETNK
jgi:hypothetical protein